MISNEGFKYFQSQKYLSSFLCLPKCVQIIKKCVKNWFRDLMADNCGMHLKIKSSVVCLKEQTVLQTLHTKNYFIQWWKNGERSFANHINTRRVQQDFSKIHVQIICYEERFMVTHMLLFLYFNFLTNVFSFFISLRSSKYYCYYLFSCGVFIIPTNVKGLLNFTTRFLTCYHRD